MIPSKEQIKQTLEMVFNLNGSLTISYIPSSRITPEGCYNLYYGGRYKMEIYPEYYRDGSCNLETYEDLGGIDAVIDRIYNNLEDNIGDFIIPALDNLKLDDSDLKYFDRDLDLFNKFKQEINKLKNESINNSRNNS
jgi:hypothetical protein